MKNVTNNINKGKSSPINSISHPLDKCCVTGCTEDADVKILVARNPKGFMINAGDHGVINISGENISLKTGYTFIRWVSRCCAHYAQDVARSNRAALENVRSSYGTRNNQ